MDATTSSAIPPPPPGAVGDPEELLDGLLRQIITGFFVLTDGQGNLSKWSDPAELLFGRDADDALMSSFFGTLLSPVGLSPDAEAWRAFLETGGTPGSHGRVRVTANKPGGGTFLLEATFIPVKLDEGFDFSLFLEDLAFELPLDMMLLRMRQQHPVVIRALRGSLADAPNPWDGVRTAGTLVAFRPLEPTPWMDAAMARREAEIAAAEAEMAERMEAIETGPEVQGTDVYDLEDARAVIDRLKWATERIEELEQKSLVAEDAVATARDAQQRAQAAERAAQEARAEISGAIATRPVDASSEADRLELLARVERVERSANQAAEAAAEQRLAAENERARASELESQRNDLSARLADLEQRTGASNAIVETLKAELVARLESVERRSTVTTTDPNLAERLEVLEARPATASDEIEQLRAQIAEAQLLREEIQSLRSRADDASGVLRRGEEREVAALREAEASRTELAAALNRVEQLSEETARLRSHMEGLPTQLSLAAEDRHKLDLAAAGADEARTGLEAIRFLAEELRNERSGLQSNLTELSETDGQTRQDLEALRREQADILAQLDEARGQLREAVRNAEEARALVERGPVGPDGAVPATADEVSAARERLDELAGLVDDVQRRVEGRLGEVSGELREEVREAHRVAREAADRAEAVDRNSQATVAELRTAQTAAEDLARAAQHEAGEARDVASRLEAVVEAAREQAEGAVVEAAGARETAAAASQAATSLREMMGDIGEMAREAVAPELAHIQTTIEELRSAPADEAFEKLQADVDRLRSAVESGEGGDAAALKALGERVSRVEASADVPEVVEARIDSLRDGVAGALGKLEGIAVEMAAVRNEAGAGRQVLEERLADNAAELMAARTDAEQARKGLEGLREELGSLREYAAAAKAEAVAAKEAAHNARRAGNADEQGIESLRMEVQSALQTMEKFKHGFEEARQAAVAARRDADMARSAAERAGVVNEATQEKFTEVWQKMLTTPQPGRARGGSGVVTRMPLGKAAAGGAAQQKREPRAGFDDDTRPMAVLDLSGKFVQLNPAFSKLVGYDEKVFGKATWPSVLDRKTYKDQVAQLNALVTAHVDQIAFQSTYMHGQGLMVPVDGTMFLQRDAEGKPNHLLLVAG